MTTIPLLRYVYAEEPERQTRYVTYTANLPNTANG